MYRWNGYTFFYNLAVPIYTNTLDINHKTANILVISIVINKKGSLKHINRVDIISPV
jgi:hypothetical protein